MKLNLATTTRDFAYYGKNYKEIIDLVKKTPFRYLDCNINESILKESLLLGDDWQHRAKEIRDYAESLGIKFIQAHAPMGRPIVKDGNYESFMFLTKRAVEVAYALGSECIVVHSGYEPDISKEECFEKNKSFYLEILEVAQRYGINILTENFNKMSVPNIYWVDNARDELALVEYVSHPLFHACWDTGHGNMQKTAQREALNILGKEVYALHVQDNMGDSDTHFAPYFGTMDLDSLMEGLRDINYGGYFTFESMNLMLPATQRKNEVDGKLLATPPLHLKLAAEGLLYGIGEHILNTYGMI